jgi:hypothetical protein
MNYRMRRVTITLPDDLAKAVEGYRSAQEAPPALTTVVQAALREFLTKRGFLRGHQTAQAQSGPKSKRSMY